MKKFAIFLAVGLYLQEQGQGGGIFEKTTTKNELDNWKTAGREESMN